MEHITSKKPFLIVLLGDFNARMQGWYQNNITTSKGCKIDIATSHFGLSQIIKEPTHILRNLVSWTDLTFMSQPNLVMPSGVHSSLHQNYHHQIVLMKFNFSVSYPPSTYQVISMALINKLIQILLNEPLIYLTGKKVFLILMCIDEFLFSTNRLWTSLKILFCTKQ